MNAYETLSAIQTELSAPKGQFNKFGGYAYRSCEDILEALKPLLKKHKACVTISDDVIVVGDGNETRFYIKATATLHTADDPNGISKSALAREALDKKGMDAAQVTGSTSSYARKYALNGLFAIDDNKEPDATNTHEDAPKTAQKPSSTKPTQVEAHKPVAPPVASATATKPTEPKELDYIVPTGKWAGYKLRDAYKSNGRGDILAEYNNPESGEKFKRAVEAVEAFITASRK